MFDAYRQTNTIAELTRELEWFRRNMFGKKSETSKRFEDYEDPDVHQLSLFDSMSDEQKLMLGIADEKTKEKITVNSFKRTKCERKKKRTLEELLANAKKGEDKLIYASDEEKTCELCESEMSHFGWEYIRTEVEHIDSKYSRSSSGRISGCAFAILKSPPKVLYYQYSILVYLFKLQSTRDQNF